MDFPATLGIYDAEGPYIPLAKEKDSIWQDNIILSGGEEAIVLLDTIAGLQAYTIVVKSNSGKELFRRTLTQEQLAELEWQLTITVQGIE